ncbi:hypothetical protein [uncultured Clostridium sp.]|uniref:hypothetical protein n=1 Tax=uncultured Clostridium sp. TaxID=59620 RepID=UPI0025DE05E9|nr:hypothetical protein [uncultured Clostridium sp.]
MKKKYLSLVMAAMMSLGAVVQASAVTISGNEAETLSQSVEVTGNISNSEGQAPAGKLEVELPTTMTFSVDKNGEFTGIDYSVKNSSACGIIVSVAEFKKANVSGGIIIKEDSTSLDNLGRENVILKLSGTSEVDLYDFINDSEHAEEEVLKVDANSTKSISLQGAAGKNITSRQKSAVDEKGLSEKFTLRFNIKMDSSKPATLSEEGPWNEVPAYNEKADQE